MLEAMDDAFPPKRTSTNIYRDNRHDTGASNDSRGRGVRNKGPMDMEGTSDSLDRLAISTTDRRRLSRSAHGIPVVLDCFCDVRLGPGRHVGLFLFAAANVEVDGVLRGVRPLRTLTALLREWYPLMGTSTVPRPAPRASERLWWPLVRVRTSRRC